ncbi:MAG: hypothetical protein LBL53_00180 [Endomicrobium sp.]|nr:hypothetical protein [Endomicrobium sp.]
MKSFINNKKIIFLLQNIIWISFFVTLAIKFCYSEENKMLTNEKYHMLYCMETIPSTNEIIKNEVSLSYNLNINKKISDNIQTLLSVKDDEKFNFINENDYDIINQLQITKLLCEISINNKATLNFGKVDALSYFAQNNYFNNAEKKFRSNFFSKDILINVPNYKYFMLMLNYNLTSNIKLDYGHSYSLITNNILNHLYSGFKILQMTYMFNNSDNIKIYTWLNNSIKKAEHSETAIGTGISINKSLDKSNKKEIFIRASYAKTHHTTEFNNNAKNELTNLGLLHALYTYKLTNNITIGCAIGQILKSFNEKETQIEFYNNIKLNKHFSFRPTWQYLPKRLISNSSNFRYATILMIDF